MASIRLKGKAVKEGSVAYVGYAFTDRNGLATLPDALTYRIDCLTSQTEILGWTVLTAQQSGEIVIASTQNRIVDQANAEEVRQVTLKASGADGDVLETVTYRVQNLYGVG